jgi:hypothetical protein
MVTEGRSRPVTADPVGLHERAADNLRYIRETMERATAFTAVSGWGLVIVGLTAIATAAISSRASGLRPFVVIWGTEAVLACLIAVGSMAWKARRTGTPVLSGPGRKFVLSFLPAIVAGVVLTVAMFRGGTASMLPGVWLLLYGSGVVAAGAFSVSTIPLMGACFMTLGAVACLLHDVGMVRALGVGFGILHVIFGLVIARKHGG